MNSRRTKTGTARALRGLMLIMLFSAVSVQAGTILFIGNSFTFGLGSPVQFYRAESVNDLNNQGIGGVPALFKSFTLQSGLNYDVFLETQPGVGLDWHLAHKRDVLARQPWDTVVMHGFSTLDQYKPGDPATLIASTRQMAELLSAKNASVELRLMETWPRADQVFEPQGAWYGKSVEAMGRDLHAAYEQAAAGIAYSKPRVAPVGDAWLRAMQTGLADANPYDGIEANKIDLWTYDHYHGSTFGYYLEALVVFGTVTGLDPRALGAGECSGFELGLSPAQVQSLQQVAADQLVAQGFLHGVPSQATRAAPAARCPVPAPRRRKVPPA